MMLLSHLFLFPYSLWAGLVNGLVAYWSFDGCDAIDETGNGYDGTLHGEPECVSGVKGKAFKFDGIDDYIEILNSINMSFGNMTITAWVNPYNVSSVPGPYNQSMILNKESAYEIALFGAPLHDVDESELGYAFNADWYWYGSGYYFELKNPFFIAVVLTDQNLAKIYINGELVSEHQYDVPTLHNPPNLHKEIIIGARSCAYYPNCQVGSFFEGILDEIRIYNRVLSQSEIQELHSICYSQTDMEDATESAYRQGYEEAKEYCRLHPTECGIASNNNSCDMSCAASFNMFTNTLHIPCLEMGQSYWLDLELINSDPIQLELKGFGEN